MADKVCDMCGKNFIMPRPTYWTYRIRSFRKENYGRTYNFCCYTCQEKFKKERMHKKEYNCGFKVREVK